MPSASGVTQAATGAPLPSTRTRHMRQAPQFERRSCWQMVGTSAPAARTASRMVAPSDSIGRPSTVTRFIARSHWRRALARVDPVLRDRLFSGRRGGLPAGAVTDGRWGREPPVSLILVELSALGSGWITEAAPVRRPAGPTKPCIRRAEGRPAQRRDPPLGLRPAKVLNP